MALEWHQLTDMTGTKPFLITSVRLEETGATIAGDFELPPLARLPYEDQVFVIEFVRQHGSIKEMERAFGISYPTVKNRLRKIADQLALVHVEYRTDREEILNRLERGEIDAAKALDQLGGEE